MLFEKKLQNIRYVIQALRITWKEETSFRLKVYLMTVVFALAAYLPISRVEWALLALAFSAVLATELINTALERVGNAFALPNDPLIGLIKDLGAAAAAAVEIGAVIVACLVFISHFL